MLTFQPLKTKALIIQGNIRRKRRILNTVDLSLNCRLTRHFFLPILKNPFDEIEINRGREYFRWKEILYNEVGSKHGQHTTKLIQY